MPEGGSTLSRHCRNRKRLEVSVGHSLKCNDRQSPTPHSWTSSKSPNAFHRVPGALISAEWSLSLNLYSAARAIGSFHLSPHAAAMLPASRLVDGD